MKIKRERERKVMCFYEQDQHTQKDHRKIDSLEKQQNKTVVVMTTFSAKKKERQKKSKMMMAITGVCVDDFNFKFFVYRSMLVYFLYIEIENYRKTTKHTEWN